MLNSTLVPSEAAPEPLLAVADGVEVFGGFPATLFGREGHPNDRDPAERTVIDAGEDRFHAVTMGTGALLDGFEIVNGRAEGPPDDGRRGAGVFILGADDVTLRNLRIADNFAREAGAGVCCGLSNHLTMENVELSTNIVRAPATGAQPTARGAGATLEDCTSSLVDVLITENTTTGDGRPGAAHGGGLWVDGELTLTAVSVTGNVAQGAHRDEAVSNNGNKNGGDAFGGGVFVATSPGAPWRIAVSGNNALSGDGADGQDCNCAEYAGRPGNAHGGGLYVADGAMLSLTDSLVTNNTADVGQGGATAEAGCAEFSDFPPYQCINVIYTFNPGRQPPHGGAAYVASVLDIAQGDGAEVVLNSPEALWPCGAEPTGLNCE